MKKKNRTKIMMKKRPHSLFIAPILIKIILLLMLKKVRNVLSVFITEISWFHVMGQNIIA